LKGHKKGGNVTGTRRSEQKKIAFPGRRGE